MKNKIQKIITSFLCVMLVVTLAGCAAIDSAISDIRGDLVGNGYAIHTYDNYGKLKSVKQRKETIAAYSTSTIKTDSLSADTDSYIKLFLWEDGMKPLYNSITIKEAK